ncbi:MAG: (Fe-S)-binding protein [Ignavibacteriales bacterium]|nr:(Fe-S)-binding protein [Ignavibacteriales bacterium]
MAEPPLQKSLLSGLISDDLLLQCMHCGMCLPTCPTYNVTKLESSSPRGRIRLIKSVSEGKLEINDTYLNEISFCLDCQACETACPAGVKYGAIVEAAREEVSRQNLEPLKVRTIRRFGLNFIVANQPILKIVARLIYFYQASGLQKFLHNIGMFKIMGGNLGAVDQMSPKFSKRFSSDMMSEIYTPAEPVRYRVLLPLGCLMDVAFADINSDTLDVLLQHGCEVIIPRNQGCCGSLHAHNGEQKKGKELALKTMELFKNFEYDFLISNSAGCGAYMKEYGHVFEDTESQSHEVTSDENFPVMFSSKVKDISEFLYETGFRAENYTYEGRITYHDACHLAHTQKITLAPREIIKSVGGVNYTELNEASWCCGSAGIYNVARYDDALNFLVRKMGNLKATGSEVVVMANPGVWVRFNMELINMITKWKCFIWQLFLTGHTKRRKTDFFSEILFYTLENGSQSGNIFLYLSDFSYFFVSHL